MHCVIFSFKCGYTKPLLFLSGCHTVFLLVLRESRSPCDSGRRGDEGSGGGCCCRDPCPCASHKESLARVGKESLPKMSCASRREKSQSLGRSPCRLS